MLPSSEHVDAARGVRPQCKRMDDVSHFLKNWFHRQIVSAVRCHLHQQRLPAKVLLLLDNCGAHPKMLCSNDKKIVISFLPKNKTSKIQLMVMGIIATSKRLYRRQLVRSVTARGDLSLLDFLKKLTIKEAIYMFDSAWQEVSRQTIHGCWRRALGDAIGSDEADDSDGEFEGFSTADVSQAEKHLADFNSFSAVDVNKSRDAFGVTDDKIDQWLKIDDELATTAHLTDEEIVANATGACTEADENNDDDEEEMEPLPAMSSIVRGLEEGLRWLETSADIGSDLSSAQHHRPCTSRSQRLVQAEKDDGIFHIS
ncbi:jerky protein homolog-like [Dreissena polymorpha]|uniref:jerky protein homolog-like n=1 Tax=Dreissena polymorpha TaxID=45954 RepID=UPI002264A432|nr:jerky protein homolog-like [Dreissena polymorpha]